ncbi:MAG: glycosyltransferase family 9 protein [Cyclobacteriaceae bacterium]|jgi:heptosyltransferase-2|nr:heptosyltransferase [Cytophagales bacterium]HNP76968.1 glycosyltransferase family 9 protein [Cyclobacteriaceae bacterium]
MSRSFLIIQTAFIGDVILATALIESLKRKFPDASIDMVVRRGNESLLQGHPLLREVIVFDKRNKYRNLFHLIRKIRSNRYSAAINVQRFATTGIITVCSGAGETVGFDKNPFSFLFSRKIPHQQEGMHEIQRNHLLIAHLISEPASRPRLYPTKDQFDKIAAYGIGSYITLSPASVWFTKQHAKEKWLEFLQSIPDHLKVYLLGAASDQPLCEELRTSGGNASVTTLAGKLSLLESAALMRGAVMNYVNDSAPMHLASALNAPVTAVYCSTVPEFGFGPLSDQSIIVQTNQQLSCRPCGLHGFKACPQGHFRCSLDITVSQLTASLTA